MKALRILAELLRLSLAAVEAIIKIAELQGAQQ